jgi:phospholipid/cholesterol/gamma-HCH transport system substrate-binding protein
MLKTLDYTNQNIKEISVEVKSMVKKLNSPNSLWSILMDTVVAENLKQTVVKIKLTAENSATVTGDLSRIIGHIKAGKGTIGALLSDTVFSSKLNQSIINIKLVSDTLATITGDLHSITSKIKNGEGAIGTILMDTSFVSNLNKTMLNARNGTKGFDDNMEALKHNILLRKYFKKKAKAATKNNLSK